MKGTNEDFVKGRFTKYLETAVDRARRDYLKKEEARIWKDVSEDMETSLYGKEKAGLEMEEYWLVVIEEIPWEADTIRQYLKNCLDFHMWKSLSHLTDMEMVVVFGKVFRQLTFAEIAEKMGIEPQKVASVYSYARKKVKKGWERNGT